MTSNQIQTIREYVNFLALSNKVDTVIVNEILNYINIGKCPQSIEEATSHAGFWSPIVDKFKEDIEKMEFFYQEKDKELPLSSKQKLVKFIGLKIKPKLETGEVKYDEVNPELIRDVNISKSLVNIITNENEWKKLNAISQNSDTFSAPFGLLPKNLCYQVNIPLECINGIKFKSPEFLNKQYTNKN